MSQGLKSAIHAAALISLAGILAGFQPSDVAKERARPANKEPAPKGNDEKPAATHDFKIDDAGYADVCSCQPPCACELIGPDMTCKGAGAFDLRSARFDGKDISGTRIAYALGVGKWVHAYVDQRDPKKRDAAHAFAAAALAGFGDVKFVKGASVKIEEKADRYTVTVDGGKVMKFETEPVLGGDDQTPLTYSNIKDPVHPVVMQGRAVSCAYSAKDGEGDRAFRLEKGRNAFFNNHIKSSGTF